MKKLVIDNIGPIKHVELNMKRVNVIIGPQSAGKSCILKIACFCAWAEKRIQLEQGKNGFADDNYVVENLIEFHKMEGFFKPGRGAHIRYESSQLWFEYDYDARSFEWDWKRSGHWKYKRSRVSYIPAERNVIATIPNWMEVSMPFDYVRNFISDWSLTRQLYGENNELSVLGLGVKYLYDKQSGKDFLILPDGRKLPFTNGSSGLQSVVPMMAYLKFLFVHQYNGEQFGKLSVESEKEEILNHIYDKKFSKGMKTFVQDNKPYIGKIGVGKRMFKSEKDYQICKDLFDSYTQTFSSDIYLEEPEQNLFPETQLQLVYDILRDADRHMDRLFIATHSPFILFAINNCLMGGLVGKNVPEDIQDELHSAHSWIIPSEVAIWSIEDGVIKSLQDEDGLLGENFINMAYRNVSNEFITLLNYYNYAQKDS